MLSQKKFASFQRKMSIVAQLGFTRADLRMLRNFLRMMVRDRFLGSGLGILWAIANPVLMLGIFTFVFGYVFKSKLPGAETSLSYVVWLISGYGPWLAASEGLTASANSVTSNTALVKNVGFKTELLPIAATLIGAIPLFVTLIYLSALLLVVGTKPSLYWFTIVAVVVFQFIFVMGLGMILGALNVFVRDVALILPNILLIVMFASPIFYPIDVFPAVIRPIAGANPFYLFAAGVRLPLVESAVLSLHAFAYLAILSICTFALGLMVFRRLQPFFDSRL